MKPKYFDIHSHLNFKDFDADREQVIGEMQKQGIWTITVGTSLETSRESVELAEKYDGMFATIGLHPADDPAEVFGDVSREALAEWDELVKSPKVVAIGECGLDYKHISEDGLPEAIKAEKKRQKKEFEKQIEFAVRYDKPLMIHCRPAPRSLGGVGDAYLDCIEILKSKQTTYGDKVRGNFHFFTSPIEIAKRCLEIGFSVSFTGPITFTTQYDELIKYVPLESMMVETDAPYAAPAPYRGKRNSPLYVPEIVKKIAAIKGKDESAVAKILVENAFKTFLAPHKNI